MAFDLRGAVMGGAYANHAMQQAKYQNRKDEQMKLREEQQADMQRQQLAIQRFQAQTEYQFNMKEVEDRRKKVLAAEAQVEWTREQVKEQQKLDAEGRKKEQTHADRMFMQKRSADERADEDRDRGYGLDLLEHERLTQKDADLKEWRTERNRISSEQKKAKAPTTQTGMITAYDEMYWEAWKEIKEENPNWSRLSDEKLRVLTEQALDIADGRIGNFVDLYNRKIDTGKQLTAEGILQPTEEYLDIQSLRGSFQQRLSAEGSTQNTRLRSQRREVYAEILYLMRADPSIGARYNAGELTEKEEEAIRAASEAGDESIPEQYYTDYLKIKARRSSGKGKVSGHNVSTGSR